MARFFLDDYFDALILAVNQGDVDAFSLTIVGKPLNVELRAKLLAHPERLTNHLWLTHQRMPELLDCLFQSAQSTLEGILPLVMHEAWCAHLDKRIQYEDVAVPVMERVLSSGKLVPLQLMKDIMEHDTFQKTVTFVWNLSYPVNDQTSSIISEAISSSPHKQLMLLNEALFSCDTTQMAHALTMVGCDFSSDYLLSNHAKQQQAYFLQHIKTEQGQACARMIIQRGGKSASFFVRMLCQVFVEQASLNPPMFEVFHQGQFFDGFPEDICAEQLAGVMIKNGYFPGHSSWPTKNTIIMDLIGMESVTLQISLAHALKKTKNKSEVATQLIARGEALHEKAKLRKAISKDGTQDPAQAVRKQTKRRM